MTETRSERRHGNERRWCSDRRARERRRTWQFDRRRQDLLVPVERRSGAERRGLANRRGHPDRRALPDRRVCKLHWCEAEEGGDACGRRAMLKSPATGAWHCLRHLGTSSMMAAAGSGTGSGGRLRRLFSGALVLSR